MGGVQWITSKVECPESECQDCTEPTGRTDAGRVALPTCDDQFWKKGSRMIVSTQPFPVGEG